MTLYGPNSPGKLAGYLQHCIRILDGLPSSARIGMFLTFRYDCINAFYPHEVFSVHEATPDFFPRTLAYITGTLPIPETKPDDRPFRANYLDWCRVHAKEERDRVDSLLTDNPNSATLPAP